MVERSERVFSTKKNKGHYYKPKSVKEHFDCMDKANGPYAADEQKCVPFFYYCFYYKMFAFNCENGLYYNPAEKRCLSKENVSVCNSTRPTFMSRLQVYKPTWILRS